MALEIEKCEKKKTSCTFCMYVGTSYRLHYTANTKYGRSVIYPFCRKCYSNILSSMLEVNTKEARTDENLYLWQDHRD